MEKLFEIATRKKLRFPFKGQITVEDLWDLKPENLDSIYKTLNAENKKEQSEESLMVTKRPESDLDVQIEIVRYIFTVKMQEINDRIQEKERADQKRRLLAIYAQKENEEIAKMSKEDLKKMIDALG